MVRIAINGLGRIGRCVLRAIFEEKIEGVELVVVNGPAEIEQHVNLLQNDSIHGRCPFGISHDEQNIIINNKKIPLTRERDIANINWANYKVDIVMECTGKFTTAEDLQRHIVQGAKKVMLSSPAKSGNIKTIIHGVNNDILTKNDRIISIGSCTTNCLAPLAKALNDAVGIEKGIMTTIHSYTGDQNLVDGSHKDPRRARAASLSMVPTSTGAAKAIGLVLPELNGKLDGSAIRVPTPNVSVVDLTFEASRSTTKEEVISIIKNASENGMKNVLKVEERPLVSIDFNHTPYSSIFDAMETKVLGGNMVRVLSWYDNEWGFSCRMLDLAKFWQNL
ncbi:MAG: glyceraldehyde 3-phosphate dehydrogenase [Candidatus Deianiraeaceae bacterium]|jgi:glyceraldehyde 3-phosphate dehydrogenase